MKTIDLSDLKVGDKAWHYQSGVVMVVEICKDNIYCISTENGAFTIGGREWINDRKPTLFHSEQEFREYWGLQRDINAPLTKREQFAMAAMQGLLANPNTLNHYDYSMLAVEQADLLLDKLNEKP
jgi:hypothetical protein